MTDNLCILQSKKKEICDFWKIFVFYMVPSYSCWMFILDISKMLIRWKVLLKQMLGALQEHNILWVLHIKS